MHFDLPPLPYKKDALEPTISEETLELHHGKHQAGYVEKLNAIEYVEGLPERTPLEQIVLNAIEMQNQHLYDMAAQVWNHAFYFHCMKEDGGGEPMGKIALEIKNNFGGFENFKDEVIERAKSLFGSGWIWLVFDPQSRTLEFFSGKDADTPFPLRLIPLWVVDVWEHAYYLDHHNRRAEYVEAVLDNLVNWEFVNDNCRRAKV